MSAQFILKITCADRAGIVAGVAQCVASVGGNILESAQYSDEATGVFFMRIALARRLIWVSTRCGRRPNRLLNASAGTDKFIMRPEKMRAAIKVSKDGHYRNHLKP